MIREETGNWKLEIALDDSNSTLPEAEILELDLRLSDGDGDEYAR